MKTEALIDVMARDWYGYGTWNAPYWFIGMEPGGDETIANALAWDRVGRGELVDCKDHHLRAGFDDWHREEPKIQQTWGPLIRLLLAVKGQAQADSQVRMYQRDAWGSVHGETVVAELSAISAPNLGTDVPRTLYREHRKQMLRDRLRDYSPRLLVFYGKTYQAEWESILCTAFDPDEFRVVGTTLAVAALHPTSRPNPGPKYWIDFGNEIAGRIRHLRLT